MDKMDHINMDRIKHLLLLILEGDYVHSFGLDRAVDMAIDQVEDLRDELRRVENDLDAINQVEYLRDELRCAEDDLNAVLGTIHQLTRQVDDLEAAVEDV